MELKSCRTALAKVRSGVKERRGERKREGDRKKISFVTTGQSIGILCMLGFYTLLLIALRGTTKELVQSVTGIQVVVKSNNTTLLVTPPK